MGFQECFKELGIKSFSIRVASQITRKIPVLIPYLSISFF